jgi:hypothetical protein
VNDLGLLMSGHCPPLVIKFGTLKCTTGEALQYGRHSVSTL